MVPHHYQMQDVVLALGEPRLCLHLPTQLPQLVRFVLQIELNATLAWVPYLHQVVQLLALTVPCSPTRKL
jgi:hypothetical protein